MRAMFQEEATETGEVEEKKERVRDDAKVSDLDNWKKDGVIDRNRDVGGGEAGFLLSSRSWEEKPVEMQRLKYETEIRKRGHERNTIVSHQPVEDMKAEGWGNIS